MHSFGAWLVWGLIGLTAVLLAAFAADWTFYSLRGSPGGSPMRRVGIWLLPVLAGLAVVFVVVFAGDFAIYKLQGSPHSSVTVSQFMSVPLKGQKTEYDFLGTADVACAQALFPQDGLSPCWHLRRNPNQWENVGTPQY